MKTVWERLKKETLVNPENLSIDFKRIFGHVPRIMFVE